jgi:hypothetical protein
MAFQKAALRSGKLPADRAELAGGVGETDMRSPNPTVQPADYRAVGRNPLAAARARFHTRTTGRRVCVAERLISDPGTEVS